MDRRSFIQNSAIAATAAKSALVARENRKPRRVGLIGAGWYGKVDLLHLLQVEPVEVVSICDVDSKMLSEAADLFQSRQSSGNRPTTFGDFRKQLSEVEHDLIIVGTPDHWHALTAIEAMKSGAHVYCEKPTACDVLESKAMLDWARKLNRKLQIGTQRRRLPHILRAKRNIIEKGLLGDIGMVEMCCYYHMRNRNTIKQSPDQDPPENLDFELWSGPAPRRPYNNTLHPKTWRAYMEYSNGIVGDMCVHLFDMTRWLLDLGWPSTIQSTGGILVETESRANTTDTQHVTFEYEDVAMHWTHRSWGNPPDPAYQWASVLYGSKGTLKIDFQKLEFTPRGTGKKIHDKSEADKKFSPQDAKDKDKWNVDLLGGLGSRDLMKDWLEAIDNDRLPVADIEQGHISSACCILGNISMQVGRTLKWDPGQHQVLNDAEANKLLRRPYTGPWEHPGRG